MIGKSMFIGAGLAGIVGVASVILYQTSYQVQEQADELAKLNRQIVAEQEAIQVLRAEWAYLNEPSRLERLVAQHSVLTQTNVTQLVTLDQIPAKPLPGLEPGTDQPPLLLSSAPMRKPVPGQTAPSQVASSQTAPSQAASRTAGPIVMATYAGDAGLGAAR